jgi:hypothetical protein
LVSETARGSFNFLEEEEQKGIKKRRRMHANRSARRAPTNHKKHADDEPYRAVLGNGKRRRKNVGGSRVGGRVIEGEAWKRQGNIGLEN